jgi:hypothetical protein
MPGFLNNREWATVIWLSVLVVWILSRRDLRRSLLNVFVTLIKPSKVSGLILATAGYVAAVVFLGRGVGLWTNALIGPTILWFFGAATVLLFTADKVSKETGFVRRTLIRTIGIGALVAGYATLYVFPLVVELILLPLLALIIAMVAVAEHQRENQNIITPLNTLVAIAGIAYLIYVSVHLGSDLSGAHLGSALPKPGAARAAVIDHRHTLNDDWRALVLPVWLTVALLPFIYVVGLLMAYEMSFLLIDFCPIEDAVAKRRAKVALLLGVNVQARCLGEFRAPWPYRLVREPNLRSARDVAREFRSDPLG